MPIAKLFVLHGIVLPDATFLSQISGASPTPGIEVMTEYAAGHPTPLFRGIRSTDPQITFSTSQLKTLLDEVGQYGLGLTGGNTDLYYKQVENLGTRESGSVHHRQRMTEGLLFWTSINARQNEASADCTLAINYDGTNEPVVPAGSVATAGTPVAGEFFGAGPVSINGSALSDVQEWTLESGITLFTESSASEGLPTLRAVQTTDPVLTVRMRDVSIWETIPQTGLALTGLVFYLRQKRKHQGRNWPNTNTPSKHIKFEAASGMAYPMNTSGGGNDPALAEIRIVLDATDSSSNPLTITTASNIS